MPRRSDPSWDLASVGAAFTDAAIDPSRWSAAMNVAAGALGSVGAALFPFRGGMPLFPFSPSLGETVEAYVRDGWIHRDERYRASPVVMRTGVCTDLDYTNPDDMRRHPYYQEFLRPFGLQWYGCVKVASGDDVWLLSVQRTIEQGPFTPEDVARLATLSTHLSSAAALARAFGLARIEAALGAFEASGKAVAMLDIKGEVVRVNKSAESILGDDVRIVRRRLASFNSNATAALDRALRDAIWSTGRSLSSPIVLPRRNGRPVLAYSSRLSGLAIDIFSPCQVVVVLVDLEARRGIVERELRQAFGLTSAEARLANRLMREESLEEAAVAQGIAYHTARNILKAILLKTDTHRQGQLVALLSRMTFRSAGQGDAPPG